MARANTTATTDESWLGSMINYFWPVSQFQSIQHAPQSTSSKVLWNNVVAWSDATTNALGSDQGLFTVGFLSGFFHTVAFDETTQQFPLSTAAWGSVKGLMCGIGAQFVGMELMPENLRWLVAVVAGGATIRYQLYYMSDAMHKSKLRRVRRQAELPQPQLPPPPPPRRRPGGIEGVIPDDDPFAPPPAYNAVVL